NLARFFEALIQNRLGRLVVEDECSLSIHKEYGHGNATGQLSGQNDLDALGGRHVRPPASEPRCERDHRLIRYSAGGQPAGFGYRSKSVVAAVTVRSRTRRSAEAASPWFTFLSDPFSLPQSSPGEDQPCHDECCAADRRHRAEPGRPGQRQRVEAPAKKKQARDQQPRGPCESLRCRPLRHEDAHAEEPQRVPQVILNRGLVDGERFGREPGFDGVCAERAERDRRRERDRGGKHTQTGVHWLASSCHGALIVAGCTTNDTAWRATCG